MRNQRWSKRKEDVDIVTPLLTDTHLALCYCQRHYLHLKALKEESQYEYMIQSEMLINITSI